MQRYVVPPAGHVSKKGASVLTVVAHLLSTATVEMMHSVQPAKKCGTDHLRLNRSLKISTERNQNEYHCLVTNTHK